MAHTMLKKGWKMSLKDLLLRSLMTFPSKPQPRKYMILMNSGGLIFPVKNYDTEVEARETASALNKAHPNRWYTVEPWGFIVQGGKKESKDGS